MAKYDEEYVDGVFGGVNLENTETSGKTEFGGYNENIGCTATYNKVGYTESHENVGCTGANENVGCTGAKENNVFKKVEEASLPAKPSVWSKIRSFLFQEIDLFAPIKVELTPYQQKIEDEINEFLHQEISFKGFINILKS